MVNTIRDLQVIGDAATGHEVVGLCRRMKPDIVIISVELDGLNGIEATRRIMRARPETKVILIQTSSDEDTTIRAIRSGALGLVSRNDPATHLVEALGEVKHGRSYVGPQAWRLVLGRVQRQVPARGALRLSPSEIEILKLIAGGRTSREIAAILDVSVQTILGRRQRLMHKLGARNIAGLIVAAVSRGFGIS
jgi:DNA-binding NarL/FixJ family response regulator